MQCSLTDWVQLKMGAKQHNWQQSKMDAMRETGHNKKWVQ
jgi:hypothetical protein